ncbi:MAG: hypothetical protein J0L88_14855 [Xanthomonadales bacterium]|nr:hypothetical protein [Xanthomonadales bacterium]
MLLVAAMLPSTVAWAADVVTVDDGGVGQNASLAIGADGLPLIAYRGGGNGALLVARCTTANCSSASVQGVADENGALARGEGISLAVRVNGTPVMTWYDGSADDLSFARCPNADCSGDDILRALDDSADDTGRESSMVLDAAGLVHVAYVNTTDGAVRFIRCQQLPCNNPTARVIDDDPVNFLGADIDLALNRDGKPIIAYTDSTADELLLAYCATAECDGGILITVVESNLTSVPGLGPSVAIGTDNSPVMVLRDGTNAALKVLACSDPQCLASPNQRLIDNDATIDAGYYASIAIRPDGNPVIAYQYRPLGGAGGSGLRVAECTTPTCTGPVRIVDVDFRPGEITGANASIAIGADGGAVIAYYDTATTSLKFAKCNAQTCEGPGDRLFADGFD